ncbi:hypothetical protein SO802_015705 [Lithocarpus litseifolius]|uniref:Pentatricopeptide repeat-containing protein n=1 Tax=Lithocarpus litseifolius TaxID=425828 RepID=A0AAW2CVQ8_9ROSI
MAWAWSWFRNKLVSPSKKWLGEVFYRFARHYSTLKDFLNSLLRVEMVEDVWSSISSKGCELNVFAWTTWIHALFRNGHVKEACSYYLEMMDADVMPQADTFAKCMWFKETL